MQIYVLDYDIKKSVKYLDDKRLPKMVLESAQILCTALQPQDSPYKQTHLHHPCCVWVRESSANYLWLLDYSTELSNEFKKRFGKIHKSSLVIDICYKLYNNDKIFFDKVVQTTMPQVLPEKYKHKDIVTAYRNYFINEKFNPNYYKRTKIPKWIK